MRLQDMSKVGSVAVPTRVIPTRVAAVTCREKLAASARAVVFAVSYDNVIVRFDGEFPVCNILGTTGQQFTVQQLIIQSMHLFFFTLKRTLIVPLTFIFGFYFMQMKTQSCCLTMRLAMMAMKLWVLLTIFYHLP